MEHAFEELIDNLSGSLGELINVVIQPSMSCYVV